MEKSLLSKSPLSKYLEENERVVYIARRTPNVIIGIIVVVFTVMMVYLTIVSRWKNVNLLIPLLPVLPIVLGMTFMVYHWRSRALILTDKRLLVRTGLKESGVIITPLTEVSTIEIIDYFDESPLILRIHYVCGKQIDLSYFTCVSCRNIEKHFLYLKQTA